jgi:hypothetical protein
MAKALNALIVVFALCLAATPFVFDNPDWLTRGVDLGAAVIVAALGCLGLMSSKTTAQAWTLVVTGVLLVAWGAGISDAAGANAGAAEIVLGALVAVVALVVTQIVPVPASNFYDTAGMALASVSGVRQKDDAIVVKCVLLGSMPSTIYARPEEFWKLLGMVDASVLWHMPSTLMKGWWRARKEAKLAR